VRTGMLRYPLAMKIVVYNLARIDAASELAHMSRELN